MKSAGLTLQVDGVDHDQWTAGEVTRNMKDLSGSFHFTMRDPDRSLATFPFTTFAALARLRPGQSAKVFADGELVLDGYVETVEPNIDENHAEVSISGKDKAGDLIDGAAAPDGPGEFKNVKLEDAAKRIAAPYGLKVRAEIDTGRPFPRYALDLAETGLSAIEKGARQRHALVLSDGVGGLVITRAGKKRAPADITLPGNAKGGRATFTHKGRHSETIVRGQQEKAEQRRQDRLAALTPASAPAVPGGRSDSDGSATDRERRGTTATGRARDNEIKRHRPVVHLARSQADETSAQDEADWRMRTARAESEEANYRVHGFRSDGRLWRVNELTYVSDAYTGIERDMLISTVIFREDEAGRETELTVSSPEAFDKGAAGAKRSNLKRPSKAAQGGLDGKAEAL